MAKAEVGYLPRASPGGGRSTTTPLPIAGSVEPELGPRGGKASLLGLHARSLAGNRRRDSQCGLAEAGPDPGRPPPEAC